MITRIETIEDLIIWLDDLTVRHTKSVHCEPLPDSCLDSLCRARDELEKVKSDYPDPFKQCYKCKHIYTETEKWFDKSGQGRTGLHSDCKFCRNTYQKNRRRQEKQSNPHSKMSTVDQEAINRFAAANQGHKRIFAVGLDK